MPSPSSIPHLASGHRLSAMINRPCVSIRRHRLIDATLDDLADSLGDELARFLRAAVQARLNMIISGGTDAGKTTLLRALTTEADPADRIVTIELSYELALSTSWSIAVRLCGLGDPRSDTEGQGAVSMDYLVQRANRHERRPGHRRRSTRRDEIVPMLGHDSRQGLCTIRADSTEGTFARGSTPPRAPST